MVHLQVDSVAVLLRGSEVLCVVTSLHVIVGDLHVDLVPDLEIALLRSIQ